MKPIFPAALKQGDAIALVVPASPVKRNRIDRAIQRYESLGFQIKTYGDIYRQQGYLAGDDRTRAAELMEAFADPEVAAVFPARGGTGLLRLLDLLDYDVIRQNPKIVAGFSDITALHLALDSQAGLVTFHSPHPMDGLGRSQGLSDLTARTYWRAFLEKENLNTNGYEIPLTDEERESIVTRSAGLAQGRLVGGNLALIVALLGTPYEINTAGNILLLEDIGEQPYRIDRYLAQLKLAGKLKSLAGIVLGQFTDCAPALDTPSLTLAQIFDTYFNNLNIPVLENYPTGHASDNATLPLNIQVKINADEGRLTLLESPVVCSI